VRRTAAWVAVAAPLWLLSLPGAGAAGAGTESSGPRPRMSGPELVRALSGGGFVVLLRNAATEPRSGPDAEVASDDCAGPRDLSAEGKRQAVRLGRALAELDVRVDRVLACPSCRCVDTAALAFGASARSEDLALAGEAQERDRRIARVRELLATPPEPGHNTVLVVPTGVLLYATGVDPQPEGVAHVFRPRAEGPPTYVGRVEPDEWAEVAGVSLEPTAP